MFVYFPSCTFSKLRPMCSNRVQLFLASMGVVVSGCCRPGHKSLTAEDTAVTICETCSIIIRENCPDVKCISFSELMDSMSYFPFPDYHGEEITVQDCFRAWEREAERNAVRSLLRKMNFTVTELPGTEEERNFDGEWLLQPVLPSNRELAPKYFAEVEKKVRPQSPEEREAYLKAYCERFTTGRVVCYCNHCLTGLGKGLPEGKKAVHIAELLFPGGAVRLEKDR